MRLIKHSNPDAMIDDGMCCDDPYHTPGKESSAKIIGWTFKAGVAFVVALALWLAWKAVAK